MYTEIESESSGDTAQARKFGGHTHLGSLSNHINMHMFCSFLSIDKHIQYVHTHTCTQTRQDETLSAPSSLPPSVSNSFPVSGRPLRQVSRTPSVIYFKPTLAHITSHAHLDTAVDTQRFIKHDSQ